MFSDYPYSGWLIFLIIFVFIFTIFAAYYMANAAEEKGHHKWGYFWLCVFCPFGFLVVIALPNKIIIEQNAKLIALNEKILDALLQSKCESPTDTQHKKYEGLPNI